MMSANFKMSANGCKIVFSNSFLIVQTLKLMLIFFIALAGEYAADAKPSKEPDIAIKRTTYKITGNSVQELKAQMVELGPVDKNHRHRDAYTTWYVTWDFDCGNFGSASRAERIRVKVEVKYIFPKWESTAEAPAELVQKWNDYIDALQKHEDGHKEIGVQAAREMLKKFEGLPSAFSCQEVNRAVNESGQKILNLYRQAEVKYDVETRHGATQGAQLK